MISFRFRLPFGTLKIKTYGAMRQIERDGAVPAIRCGRYYVLWWSKRMEQTRRFRRYAAYQRASGGGPSCEN